jgi:hypothetical protein
MINVSKLKKASSSTISRRAWLQDIPQSGWKQLDDVVVLMRNVQSTKMGRMDLIKMKRISALNFDVSDSSTGRDHLFVRRRAGELDQAVAAARRSKDTLLQNPRCIPNRSTLRTYVLAGRSSRKTVRLRILRRAQHL